MTGRFHDRREGGRFLAARLASYASRNDVRVFALPRGGVPVGFEVAIAIRAPLEVFLVRKLGVPGHEEYAMGAMASGGVVLVNDEVVARLGISRHAVDEVIAREKAELERREQAYGAALGSLDLSGVTVILVDDGLATGSTMKVAVQAVRRHRPAKVVVAVPVAPIETAQEFREIADQFVCVLEPQVFYAVGQWYVEFSQTTDEEVRELLSRSRERAARTHVPIL